MAKTKASKGDREARRGSAQAARRKGAVTQKSAVRAGGAKQRPRDRQAAASRFDELQRRIREMAHLGADGGGGGGTRAGGARAAPAGRRAKPAPGSAKAQEASAAKDAARRRPADQPTVEARLTDLRDRLREIADLGAAGAVLSWDQATYMPKGGAAQRARQGATLSRLAHERLTDPALGRLLDGLQPYADRLPETADDACLIRVTRRDVEKAVKVPAEFMARWSEARSASYDAWTTARPANDFAGMRPHLEKALDFSRAYASFHGPSAHVADPLIDDQDEGLTVAGVRALFDALRAELVPIVRAITAQQPADDSCLRGAFPEPQQIGLGFRAIAGFGYDLDRGRLDKTHHPFCTRFSAGDVRITTRVREDDLADALFSTLHEAGHAMYEQGVDPALDATPLGYGTSMGVHESQSRLWENMVGRSRGFWQHFYPLLRDAFPAHFDTVPLETFYRAINKVQRSLIRTDADEVTYNLHVMLRFDLELDLLEGRLQVKDLPEAWRARMQADLGVTPPDDRDGCLQDVHWYSGSVGGAFQSYTIGNILSAQFYAAALKAHPEIPREMTEGAFATLHGWLREHLYRPGRKLLPDELVRRATGSTMTIAPYISYLRGKYGELYDLPAPRQPARAGAKLAATTGKKA
jgi:carboxypeptidase Taq